MEPLSRKSGIGFIGAGALGGSLAVALSRQGYSVVAAASRTFASAQALAQRVRGCDPFRTGQEVADVADVVFITTPDDAIEAVSSAISWRPGQGAVHCSGAASLDIFEHAARQGAVAGAFHPVQLFSSVENGVSSIPGITFSIEGNREMGTFLKEMVLAMGSTAIFLKAEDKPLYHASGVMIGGLLSGLVSAAAQLWENFGFTRSEGVRALAPMMRQVSINLESQGFPTPWRDPLCGGTSAPSESTFRCSRNGLPRCCPSTARWRWPDCLSPLRRGHLTPVEWTRSEGCWRISEPGAHDSYCQRTE